MPTPLRQFIDSTESPANYDDIVEAFDRLADYHFNMPGRELLGLLNRAYESCKARGTHWDGA